MPVTVAECNTVDTVVAATIVAAAAAVVASTAVVAEGCCQLSDSVAGSDCCRLAVAEENDSTAAVVWQQAVTGHETSYLQQQQLSHISSESRCLNGSTILA